jgi:CheY-like chemotaxis protein
LTGNLRLDCRPVPLSDAVRGAVMTVTPAAQAKGVVISTRIPEQPLPVLGDTARLRQIAWHLLANAIKFTPRGGSVSIALEADGEWVNLIVTDSGPGIAPDFLPKIFDRFTQEDPSVTRAAGGLGVGLSLVHDLVGLQGGEIQARNRDDASGAIFTVRFPLQPNASLRVAPPVSVSTGIPDNSGGFLGGLRVLVLDQDAEGRELLRTILQQRGATVRTAASVADALEALEAWRPDVLVSDTPSTEHDSYTLVGKVHSLEAERGGRIPAAALTMAARTDERVKQMLEDVHGNLPKPIEPALLAAEVARLTGRERRRAHRLN